jgi:hypothetical protein
MSGPLPDPTPASGSHTRLAPAWLIPFAGALSLALLLTAARLAAAPRSTLPVLAAPGHTDPDHGAAQAACEPRGARFTCELPATPGERLIVEIPNGVTVHVTGWDQPLVSVESETDRAFNATAERVAGGVRVKVHSASGWNGTSRADLVISVPARYDVHAEAHGGGVEIRRVSGAFTGRTHRGGLVLEDVRGTIQMSTDGGGASITNAHLDGSVEMHNGGVVVEGSTGDLRFPGAASINGRNLARGGDASTRAFTVQRSGEWSDVGGMSVRVRPARADEVGAVRAGARPADVRPAQARPADAEREDGEAAGEPIRVQHATDGTNLSTPDGDIWIGRATGRVSATTARGDVQIQSLEGSARVSTASGDVVVHVAGEGGDLVVNAADGGVTVYLPAGFDGELELEAAYVQGHTAPRILSDFSLPVTESPEWDTSRGAPTRYVRTRGRLGDGRHKVRISTVHGDIRVLRAPRS